MGDWRNDISARVRVNSGSSSSTGYTGADLPRFAEVDHRMQRDRLPGEALEIPDLQPVDSHGRSYAGISSHRFSVGNIRIDFPAFFRANRNSYRLCRFSQNSALVPKK